MLKRAILGLAAVIASQLADGTPPAPPQSPISLEENLLANPSFSRGLAGWSYIKEHAPGTYSTHEATLRLSAAEGQNAHVWQAFPAAPGETIVMSAWMRASPDGREGYNSGCGLGFDLRGKEGGNILGTLNGNATTNSEWTLLLLTYTIPEGNSPDSPIAADSYRAYDQGGNPVASTTGGGARWGRDDAPYEQFPDELTIYPWFHNWHNSMEYCELKDPRFLTIK